MIYKVLIPAGRVANLSFPSSSVFFVVSCTEGFEAKINGARTAFSSGEGFGNPGSKQFSKATFYSMGAVDNTVEVWLANSEWKSPLTEVQNNVNVSAALANTLAACADALPSQFHKAANAGQVVALANAGTKFRWALLIPARDEAGTPNVGPVYLGASGAANKQGIEISGTWVLPVPSGAKFDFSNWFLKPVNNGDGLIIIYT